MDNELINQLAILQLALPLGVIFVSPMIRVATLVGALLRMTAILGLLFYTALAGMGCSHHGGHRLSLALCNCLSHRGRFDDFEHAVRPDRSGKPPKLALRWSVSWVSRR